MEDKVIAIVFGTLDATLALVSILFAYLQLRGFRPAIAPDEEPGVPLAVVAHAEPVPNQQYASSHAAFHCGIIELTISQTGRRILSCFKQPSTDKTQLRFRTITQRGVSR
jgi:hypothetical protein